MQLSNTEILSNQKILMALKKLATSRRMDQGGRMTREYEQVKNGPTSMC